MQRLLKPLIVALAAALPLAAAAQVYTWKDASGTVHYSQSPPPHGVKYHQIRLHGINQPSTPAPAPAPDGSAGNTPTHTAGTGPMVDNSTNRKRFCKQTQANMQLLQSKQPVTRTGPKGKTHLLDRGQRGVELEHARQQYARYCGH